MSVAAARYIKILTSRTEKHRDLDKGHSWAALKLAELASRHADFQTAIVSAGGIPALVDLMNRGTEVQIEAATRALSCLCTGERTEHQTAISAAGCIPSLIALVERGSARQKEWAALALGNLAAGHAENQTEIATAGGVPALISLLNAPVDGGENDGETASSSSAGPGPSSEHEDTIGKQRQKEWAAVALSNLVANHADNTALVREDAGGLVSLVKLAAGSTNTDGQREAATLALAVMAQGDRLCHSKIARERSMGRDGSSIDGIQLLAEFQRYGTKRQQAYAAAALESFAEGDARTRAAVAKAKDDLVKDARARRARSSRPLKTPMTETRVASRFLSHLDAAAPGQSAAATTTLASRFLRHLESSDGVDTAAHSHGAGPATSTYGSPRTGHATASQRMRAPPSSCATNGSRPAVSPSCARHKMPARVSSADVARRELPERADQYDTPARSNNQRAAPSRSLARRPSL